MIESLVLTLLRMNKAEKLDAEADKKNIKAFDRINESERIKDEQEHLTRISLEKLANRKKGIMATSIRDFISLYENIMQIDFVEGDGIKQLGKSTFMPTILKEMRNMVEVSGYSLSSSQAISTYVVGTFLGGGIAGGISKVILKESELNFDAAKKRNSVSRVIESQNETITTALDAIYQRSERLSKLLAKTNLLFIKSIGNTKSIIEKNGRNRLNYTSQEKSYIMTCMNLADAVKKILDLPLLDEEGEINQKSIEAIQIGEQYLLKINNNI